MTKPQERIENDLKAAMRSGEKERVGTLRMLLAEINNERIRAGEEVDEEGFFGLVRKAIKQRREAAEQFRKGGREESAAKEEREAEILEAYLPEQVDEAEIRQAIAAFVDEHGLSGPPAMGPVMKEMMSRFAGRTDGSVVSRIAREILAAGR